MLNIVGKKNWYFLISFLIIIPGIISMCLWGLRLSIDFTGGSRIILLFDKKVNQKKENRVKDRFKEEKNE
ncbi:hypothetical protein KJ980_05815, partial [Patescibacteria group bacterium]|nr:hypothetical protein [Patescibacteria group bacterium]